MKKHFLCFDEESPSLRQIKKCLAEFAGHFHFERSDVPADLAREIRRDKFLIEPDYPKNEVASFSHAQLWHLNHCEATSSIPFI